MPVPMDALFKGDQCPACVPGGRSSASPSSPQVLFNACGAAVRLNPCHGPGLSEPCLGTAPMVQKRLWSVHGGGSFCSLATAALLLPLASIPCTCSLDRKGNTVNASFSQIPVTPGIPSLEEPCKNRFWSVSEFSN